LVWTRLITYNFAVLFMGSISIKIWLSLPEHQFQCMGYALFLLNCEEDHKENHCHYGAVNDRTERPFAPPTSLFVVDKHRHRTQSLHQNECTMRSAFPFHEQCICWLRMQDTVST
jgi:hypothetical protein